MKVVASRLVRPLFVYVSLGGLLLGVALGGGRPEDDGQREALGAGELEVGGGSLARGAEIAVLKTSKDIATFLKIQDNIRIKSGFLFVSCGFKAKQCPGPAVRSEDPFDNQKAPFPQDS